MTQNNGAMINITQILQLSVVDIGFMRGGSITLGVQYSQKMFGHWDVTSGLNVNEMNTMVY